MTRNLALYLLSRATTGIGHSLVRAAMLWHLWRITKSEAMVGALGLFMVVPGAGFALVGGAIADAHDRRRVIQIAQSAALVVSVVMLAIATAGALTAPVIYLAGALLATSTAFEAPSRSALLSQVIAREGLPRAITWASTVQALAFATGPALAGVIIGKVGVEAAYTAHVVLLAVSIGSLFVVKIVVEAARRAASFAAVKEGVAFVTGNPILLACMGLDLVAVVLGGSAALLPVFADDILAVGAEGYGVLAGALEAGALVMSVVILRMKLQRAGVLMLVAVAVYGASTLGFGMSTWFPLSVALLALAGAADQISVVLRANAVQLTTPDELRGRVSAVSMIFIVCSNQLSVVESGVTAAVLGAQGSVMLGGVCVLIVTAVVALLVPTLRAFRLP